VRLLVAVACCALLAGCGATPAAPRRDAIPVLVYRGEVEPRAFARHMALLADAGYDTIGLDAFIRYLRGDRVALPPRPFVLTFDDGRASLPDATVRGHGFEATVFVDVGRVAAGDARYLGWDALGELQRSGRWDVQLQSGTGNHIMQWGPGRGDVGSFYAYRGADEVLGGWRERVFGDLAWAERQLAMRIGGYRPLAIAPPGGNFGQAGTNDPDIPRVLLPRLQQSFATVFTLDGPALAVRGAGTARPLGRLDMSADGAETRLQALLRG
jgi:hypothetical protein